MSSNELLAILRKRPFDNHRLEAFIRDVLSQRWIAAQVPLGVAVQHLERDLAEHVAQVKLTLDDRLDGQAADIAIVAFIAAHRRILTVWIRGSSMSWPVVAIVGRPNVGKSSLFNSLARRRIAIVDPTAGVTREGILAGDAAMRTRWATDLGLHAYRSGTKQ